MAELNGGLARRAAAHKGIEYNPRWCQAGGLDALKGEIEWKG